MNYYDTFILVAEDCKAEKGTAPTVKGGKAKPIHAIQYTLLSERPYRYTQEDILFMVYAERNGLSHDDVQSRADFFKKGQPCLRSSALTKKYGWGVHFDGDGKAALYCRMSSEYQAFENGQHTNLKLFKALRNKRG